MLVKYRMEQCRVISSQYSLLNTLLMTLQQIKLVGLSHTYAINQLCVGSHEHLVNCLNMRKYLKALFAPNEHLPTPSDSEEDDDEAPDLVDGPEAEEVRLGD